MERNPNKNREPLDKNKHTDDLVDHYWGSINYVFSLVKASELKAGLILSFYGILLNFIYQHIGMILNHESCGLFVYFLLGLCFSSMIISIYFSIRCFMPRFEAKYERNIFFFGDVVTKFGNIKQFSKTFYEISIDGEQLFDQLGQQIYINSKIAATKFRNVNRSLQFLAISLGLLLITLVYYLISTL